MVRLILIAALMAGPLSAQSGGERSEPRLQTGFDSVQLVATGADHVRFEVRTHVTAAKNLTVTRVRFDQMRLGEIPFYLSPIQGPFELKSGRPFALPPISMTIYFRDIDSLAPVEEAIRDGEVRVRGHALADLDLNLVERIALREWKGHADVSVEDRIPVEIPGGFAGRTAALLALQAAQTALSIAGSTLNVMRTSQKTWSDALQREYGQSVALAESRYTLKMTDGQRFDVINRGLGFRISDERVVITGALAEPWKYDSETAAVIETRRGSVVKESYDILVWPGDGRIEDAAALSNGRLVTEKIASKTEGVMVPDGDRTVRVSLAKRDNDSNYAVLRLVGDADRGKAMPAAGSVSGQNWDHVAIYRLTEDGPPEMIFVAARRQESRLVFDTPVDDRAAGSPVMTPDGAIGILQDERSGMVLRSAW
jgi:hypothetical protein